MLRAVQLDYQLSSRTIEINNIIANGFLPEKYDAVLLVI